MLSYSSLIYIRLTIFQTENVGFSSCSVSQKSLSTTENVTSEEEQEALNIGLSLAKGKIVVNQQNEIVRNDALRGEKQMSSSKVNNCSGVLD